MSFGVTPADLKNSDAHEWSQQLMDDLDRVQIRTPVEVEPGFVRSGDSKSMRDDTTLAQGRSPASQSEMSVSSHNAIKSPRVLQDKESSFE